MTLRSLLFVPGDRPERMEKALGTGADALILDLEDSVSLANKALARAAVTGFTAKPHAGVKVLVRVNALRTAHIEADLSALRDTAADGIVLPKAEGAASIGELRAHLGPFGLDGLKILPVATETPGAVFELGTYRCVPEHLLGVTWGAEDLPAAIGATTAREPDGRYTAPYELARSLTLFGAAAAGIPAIETVFPNFRDNEGLTAYVARASRDGFTGMMAIHPSQIPIINAGFLPTEAALDRARAIVAAFADRPDAGALQINGEMIDAPHLKQAQQTLARAGA